MITVILGFSTAMVQSGFETGAAQFPPFRLVPTVILGGNTRQSALDHEFRRSDWKPKIECAQNGVGDREEGLSGRAE